MRERAEADWRHAVRPRWWRGPVVRWAVCLLVWGGLLAVTYGVDEDASVTWGRFLGVQWELQPHYTVSYVALLLLPFYARTSHRPRDFWLVLLVPLYGPFVAAKVVSRLLALPRRDWVPRPDELPRVVRIPGGRGDYVLAPTFDVAEGLRTRWCRNPFHEHPYPSPRDAMLAGCRSVWLSPASAGSSDSGPR